MEEEVNLSPIENDDDRPAAQRKGAMDIEILQRLEKISKKLVKIDKQMKTLKRSQDEIKKGLKQNLNKGAKTPCVFKQELPKITLPGSSVDECIHGEVIQQNIKILVQEVDLSNGFLIDEMLENGSLTTYEKREIEGMSNVDKTRKLATIVGQNNKSKFKKFIEVISQDRFYPHIGQLLSESYEEKLKEKGKCIECIKCFIVKNVSIKQIMDHLCELHFIDLNDVNNIIDGDKRYIHEFWEKSFKKLSDPVSGEIYVKIFKAALQEHYPYIAKRIHHRGNLKCMCQSSTSSHSSSSMDNASEISTTSTATPDPILKTHDWVRRHSRSSFLSTHWARMCTYGPYQLPTHYLPGLESRRIQSPVKIIDTFGFEFEDDALDGRESNTFDRKNKDNKKL